MKHILFYTENYASGGGNRYLIDFLNSIDEAIRVTLASNVGGISNKEESRIDRSINYLVLNTGKYGKKHLKINALIKNRNTIEHKYIIPVAKRLYKVMGLNIIRTLLISVSNKIIF